MTPRPCRSCGAPVIWAETVNGKKVPVDAEPVPFSTPGQVLTMRQAAAPEKRTPIVSAATPGPGPFYRSHFATCPQAKDWSRKAAAPAQPAPQVAWLLDVFGEGWRAVECPDGFQVQRRGAGGVWEDYGRPFHEAAAALRRLVERDDLLAFHP